MGECADCARELAHAHVFSGGLETRNIALHLGVPVGQLESESDGLSMDPVRAAHHRSVLEFPGASLQHGGEAVQVFGDDG